ncbi:MAG TPA: AroB-related putative sugar phosphate phospholyase (cyclizing) [Oligoflexus sp.]|nr:AroB-related putative sugar phosphate phospholyase (cyclizing) [Oligoflexus sp.]
MFESLEIKSRLRAYSVHFTNDFRSEVRRFVAADAFFIVDREVARLYLSSEQQIIPVERMLLVEATEPNKTLHFSMDLIQGLIEKGVKRSSSVVAIGGGVVQDLTSFLCSILFRGVTWHFIPTTLLAQADSCIGGKSSINFGKAKNLLGTFNPPESIYIDTAFLFSLPVDEIKSGIGEILHYYFYKNTPKITDLAESYAALLDDRSLLREHIEESLSIKKELVEIDEFDKGPRRLFNYGHTFGHALEAMTDYKINHGQAVTLGMDLANYVSLNLGFLSSDQYHTMSSILRLNSPDFSLEKYALDEYFRYLSLDKKNTSSKVTCILSRGLAELFVHQIELNATTTGIIEAFFREKYP